LRIEPDNPEYQTSIAQVYLQNDRAGEALRIMRKVVSAHPGQAFKYYLAIALHDDALDSLGKSSAFYYDGELIDPGGYEVVSEEQAARMDAVADEIARLNVADPDITRLVAETREMVAAARQMRWNLAESRQWLGAFVILGLLPLMIGGGSGSGGAIVFGLLAGALIVTVFVLQRHRPAWKHRLVALNRLNRLERTGI